MGGFCVSKQQKLERQNLIKAAQQSARRNRETLNNCVYAQKVRRYTQFYGRVVDNETKKFIQENYNPDYSSEVRSAGYPRYGDLTLTYKSSLIDRFETAHKGGNYTRKVEMIKVQGNSLAFVFQTSRSTYDCVAYFDTEDRFKSVIFNERAKTQPLTYYPSPAPAPKQETYQQPSNNYYGPTTDWNAHYNNEVARSNQQFRENMNRQAQEWNNYAIQKANRGW